MTKLFFFFFLFFTNSAFSQSSDLKDIDFLVTKLKTTYAGFNDKVDNIEFENLIKNIKSSNLNDTFALLSKVTSYFNDHHVKLFQKFSIKDIDTALCNTNLKKINVRKTIKPKSKLEGYWINDFNSMIIYLTVDKNATFDGYVVESKLSVPQGLCLLKIEKDFKNQLITDYIDISRSRRVFLKSKFKGAKTLMCNAYSKWKKIDKYVEGFLNDKIEINRIPEINVKDSNCIVLKMPSFSGTLLKVYDSIISANKNSLTKCKTLIIDLRNNTGGYSNCFYSLIPYICTNPILGLGSYKLISEDFLKDLKKKIDKVEESNDTARMSKLAPYFKEMLLKKDSFVFYKGDTAFECQNFRNNIKNVGIITNHACLSAAEIMILYFRQSAKVTVFGEATGGAIDYLNVYDYFLPQSNYLLWIPTTKRAITIDAPLYDAIGIKPDVLIPDSISDWVKFVRNYYGEN